MDKENLPRKKKLSLSLKNKSKRFKPTSEDELKEMAKPKIPKNTEQSSKWAMGRTGLIGIMKKMFVLKKFYRLLVQQTCFVNGSVCL